MSDDVQHSLGRIEGSLEVIQQMLGEHLKEDDKRFAKTDERLRKIENSSARAAGAGAVVGTIAGVVAGLFK
jgi:hypothetical protein